MVVFITGTDTEAGKTTATALLTELLRIQGKRAWAVKPFCSGDRGDAQLFCSLLQGELALDEINPFYYSSPVAPAVRSLEVGTWPSVSEVRSRIERIHEGCEILLVEGVGGVMAPLSKDYRVIELIEELAAPVLLVGRNRLGVLNHAQLAVEALERRDIAVESVILMDEARPDLSAATNMRLLGFYLAGTELIQVPHLGPKPLEIKDAGDEIRGALKKTKKVLEAFHRLGKVASLFERDSNESRKKL